jgi:hypothetical protein
VQRVGLQRGLAANASEQTAKQRSMDKQNSPSGEERDDTQLANDVDRIHMSTGEYPDHRPRPLDMLTGTVKGAQHAAQASISHTVHNVQDALSSSKEKAQEYVGK